MPLVLRPPSTPSYLAVAPCALHSYPPVLCPLPVLWPVCPSISCAFRLPCLPILLPCPSLHSSRLFMCSSAPPCSPSLQPLALLRAPRRARPPSPPLCRENEATFRLLASATNDPAIKANLTRANLGLLRTTWRDSWMRRALPHHALHPCAGLRVPFCASSYPSYTLVHPHTPSYPLMSPCTLSLLPRQSKITRLRGDATSRKVGIHPSGRGPQHRGPQHRAQGPPPPAAIAYPSMPQHGRSGSFMHSRTPLKPHALPHTVEALCTPTHR